MGIMASLDNSLDRHRVAINKKDSKRFKEFHAQLDRQPTADELSSGNVSIHPTMGLSERTLESREDLDSRAISAKERAVGNWGLLKNTHKASRSFDIHGREREERRPSASMWNPLEYGIQSVTGIKPISKEEQLSRNKIMSAKPIPYTRPFGEPWRRTGAEQRREKYNKQVRDAKIKTRNLSLLLEEKPGYYFGTSRDIFWWKAFDEADQMEVDNPHDVADEKYYEKYPSEIYRPLTQYATPQERQPIQPIQERQPRAPVMPVLEFSEDFMESEGHPDYILGPITRAPMNDPVVLENGISYDRTGITKWLTNHDLDPMTNQKLKSKNMVPNMSLRHALTEYYDVWFSENTPLQISETKSKRDMRSEAAEKRKKKKKKKKKKKRGGKKKKKKKKKKKS